MNGIPLVVLHVVLVLLVLVGAGPATAAPASVEQWDVFELELPGPADGNPFADVRLSARFTSGDKTVTVPGFYDGDGKYLVRFSPPSQGQWSYVTTSNSPQLEGKTGQVTATAPTGANHGPMKVHKTFHLQYADGTPYYQVGTTCYVWTHQPQELQELTLKTLATAPFNKMRMCVFPKSYTYNANDPADYPFARAADGKFDLTRFDPANWRNFERRVLDLQKMGIEADVILFHPYDRWGFAEMDDATDDFYLRYGVARLGAYRNVWWSLANEYDFMIPPLRAGQKGNKSVGDFDRFYAILEKEDPHQRLRGIHHAAKMYDHAKPWVTHASIQHRDLTRVIGWRQQYQKPVVVDECRYEGNIRNSWGNISGKEMVRQFWIGTVCGGYVGHGETLRHPQDILWWSKGGELHGESPSRIAYLRKLMEALPYTDMTPAKVGDNAFALSKPGDVHLVYATKEGPFQLKLEGAPGGYAVEAVDTWNMTSERLDPATGGDFTFTAPRADYLLRLTAIK